MTPDIIIAIIVAISTVIVAALQYRGGLFVKKRKPIQEQLKESNSINDLKDKKNAAFDNREETYNELTVCIAKHIIVHDADHDDISNALKRCVEEDEKYKDATNRYLDEITKILEQ